MVDRVRVVGVGAPAGGLEALERPAAVAGQRLSARVLLVDDDALVRRGAERSLKRLGCVVTPVADAEEALQRLAEPGQFDVVFSDLSMPGRSGEDLQRLMRERGVPTPVVILSGMIEESQERRLLANGVVCVIHKPYAEDDLRRALELTGTVAAKAE